jgi:hypothetical protein
MRTMLPTGSDGNPAGNSAKKVCRLSPAFSTLPFHLQSISLERRWCALAAVVLLGLHVRRPRKALAAGLQGSFVPGPADRQKCLGRGPSPPFPRGG